MFSGSPLRNLPYAAVAIPLFLVHLALSHLGWSLLSGSPLTPVWPSAGLDLVVLLVFGQRFWPVLFAAYFVTNFGRAALLIPALGMALANSLRPVVGVWMFTAISRKRRFLGHFEEIAAIAGTALLSPLAPTAGGTAILILGGRFPASQWELVSSRWWIADALGILIVAPVLLGIANWAATAHPALDRNSIGKTFLLAAGVAALCYFVFFRPEASYLLFLVFLLILVSAAWAGAPAARVTSLVIACAAVWATHRRGNLRGVTRFAPISKSEPVSDGHASLTGLA